MIMFEAMENFAIISPEPCGQFSQSLTSLFEKMSSFLGREAQKGRRAVFVRFFLSDAQNQAAALRKALETVPWPAPAGGGALPPAVSIVEQPPLDRSRVSALVETSRDNPSWLFHSLRLTEAEARGLDSYAQARLLFGKYLDIIGPLGLELKTHCVRTWIYVRDIDSNYAGVVRARNDVFDMEGLSHDTHYIASTGIGGATEGRNAVVAMDFLTYPGIAEEDKTYLKALSHLSPTHDYGVAFERGVKLNDGQIYISGTASIDKHGHVLHEGDVMAQTDRLLENISKLLEEGGSSLDKVPYYIVYLRDISDYDTVDAYMRNRFPTTPYVILEARVCRPAWLIEMECEIPDRPMETDRILLRPWRESDAGTLFKYASDPEVGPRAGWPPHKSEEESLNVIRTVFSGEGMWAVVLKETKEPIGCVGYLPASHSNLAIEEDQCEVGYWIARPYWNEGICTEALRLVIDHCFNVKGFKMLWGDYFPENPASGRVMEKCGFVDTGRETICPNLEVGADRPVRVLRLEKQD